MSEPEREHRIEAALDARTRVDPSGQDPGHAASNQTRRRRARQAKGRTADYLSQLRTAARDTS